MFDPVEKSIESNIGWLEKTHGNYFTLNGERNGVISKASVNRIVGFIKKSQSIKTLNLSSIVLDNEDLISIAEAIKENNSLTRVNIQISPAGKASDQAGLQAVFDAVKQKSNITSASLEGNESITQGIDIDSRIYWRSQLSSFFEQKKQNQIFDERIQKLGSSQDLPDFFIDSKFLDSIQFEKLIKAVKSNKNKTVKKFEIKDSIEDAYIKSFLEALSFNDSIENIILKSKNLKPECLLPLGKILQAIFLRFRKDPNIKPTIINLNDRQIKISKNTLTFENINDAEAVIIASIIKTSKHITEINITSNQITDEGFKSIFEAVKQNSNIQKVTLSKRQQRKDSYNFKSSLTAQPFQYQFDEFFRDRETAQAIDNIVNAKEIKIINVEFSQNNKLRSEQLEKLIKALGNNKTAEILTISTNLNESEVVEIAKVIAKHPTLTEIYINHKQSKQSSFAGITAIVEAIQNNQNIKSAIIPACSPAVKKSLDKIFRKRKNLAQIEALIVRLENNDKYLTDFRVSNNDEFQLKFTQDQITRITDALEKNTYVKSFGLNNIVIDQDSVIEITQGIRKNKSLTQLEISCCNITDYAANAVFEALQENASITHLFMLNNNLNAGSLNNSLRTLENTLKVNKTLKHIYLSGSCNVVQDLAESIEMNTVLESFQLTDNSFKSYAQKEFINAHGKINAILNKIKKELNSPAKEHKEHVDNINNFIKQAHDLCFDLDKYIKPSIQHKIDNIKTEIADHYLQNNQSRYLVEFYLAYLQNNPDNRLKAKFADFIALNNYKDLNFSEKKEHIILTLLLFKNINNNKEDDLITKYLFFSVLKNIDAELNTRDSFSIPELFNVDRIVSYAELDLAKAELQQNPGLKIAVYEHLVFKSPEAPVKLVEIDIKNKIKDNHIFKYYADKAETTEKVLLDKILDKKNNSLDHYPPPPPSFDVANANATLKRWQDQRENEKNLLTMWHRRESEKNLEIDLSNSPSSSLSNKK